MQQERHESGQFLAQGAAAQRGNSNVRSCRILKMEIGVDETNSTRPRGEAGIREACEGRVCRRRFSATSLSSLFERDQQTAYAASPETRAPRSLEIRRTFLPGISEGRYTSSSSQG